MTMTEAPLSANFNLYQGQLKVQFTYRQAADDGYISQLQAYIANLNSAGFTVEPTTPAEGGEEHAVTSYVLGLANDKNTGGKQACIFCYTDYFDMCAFVLYSNHIEMLPFEVEKTQPWQGWRPPKADAEGAGWLISCEPFTVRQEVMTDWKTGEPLLYEDGPGKGKPKKFISHINGQPVPRNGDATQPAPSQQQQARPSVPVNGNGHKPAPPPAASNGNPFDDETVGAHNPVLHALGTAFYANQWNAKRKEFSKHFQKASSKDWSASQTQSVIDGLEGHLWTAIYEIANDKGWNEERLDDITHAARKGAAMSDVSGVMLAHVYKAVQEAAVNDVRLPEGEGLPF